MEQFHSYRSSLARQRVPIVVDNGSYRCRAGWANQEVPVLDFKNLTAKSRKERSRSGKSQHHHQREAEAEIRVGNDIVNVEAVRFQLKTQFDRNTVTHLETQEHVFDHIFSHLGINTDGCVKHPIVMTETFVNPNYCRQLMSELLFECYGIPSVAYGVDSLFAFHHNNVGDTGLVINCGFHATHLIPIIQGRVIDKKSKRINLGGFQIITYLHRLLQLKYPAHLNAISLTRVEQLLHEHCYIAFDYQEEIRKWTDSDHYTNNVRKIQLPYTQPVIPSNISSEAQKERKKEMAKRLIEMNAKKREEKLAESEEQLNQLLSLQDLLEEGETDEFFRSIGAFGVKDEDDLQRQINRLNMQIEKIKQRIAASVSATDGESSQLLDEKMSNPNKIQPPNDPSLFNAWLDEFRKKYTNITEARTLRRQKRLDMAKRGTVAAQERMRLISQLARKEKANDDFGMRDEDWDVYKTISKEANDSDSDAENEKLMEISEILREYDPNFSANNENSMAEISEAHQLHLAIERLRSPEILFQPFMIGNIEAGIAETLEYMFKQFTPEEQLLLANNVFVTGGCANFNGLKERLSRELLEMRPFQSSHKVNMSKNPSLDAWFGARTFASSNKLSEYSITKQDYNEKGGEYLKEHYASNRYYQTPIAFTSGMIIESSIKDEPLE